MMVKTKFLKRRILYSQLNKVNKRLEYHENLRIWEKITIRMNQIELDMLNEPTNIHTQGIKSHKLNCRLLFQFGWKKSCWLQINCQYILVCLSKNGTCQFIFDNRMLKNYLLEIHFLLNFAKKRFLNI